MTMITVEKIDATRDVVQRMIEQGNQLFFDIAETAQDRARLLQEAEHRETTVSELEAEVRNLRGRLRDFEQRNGRLSDEIAALDSKLADATARLESISATARLDAPAQQAQAGNGGNGSDKQREQREAAGKAGVAALERLTIR